MQDILDTVAIADISVSATNPRKHFDEDALTELSKSIAQYGVMTPVLLRPLGEKYELVCGERRYRASLMAGKTEIPANIRNLSDDEAFELQIIENLERKEVHPLDEAEAFRRMLDSGKYQLIDIANKFAKTEVFVTQRLKLNDLIEDIKRDFFNGELNISQAIMISRMDAESQVELLEDYKDCGGIDGYGTTKELESEISKTKLEIAKAKFSLDEIYADEIHLLPCSLCPKRTSNNMVLFPDMQEQDSCMDKSCFRKKTDLHIIQNMWMHNNDSDDRPVYFGKARNIQLSERVKKAVSQYEITVMEEYTDIFYENTGGEKVQVMYLTAPFEGELVTRYLKKQVNTINQEETDVSVMQPQEFDEIKRLEEREIRMKELDGQKVHLTIIEKLQEIFNNKNLQKFELDPSFINSMFMYLAMNNNDLYYLSKDIESFKIPVNFNSLSDFIECSSQWDTEQRKIICSLMLFRKCKVSTSDKGIYGQIIQHLAAAHPKIDVAGIKKAQDEIAEKRSKRVAEKIAELKPEQSKKSKKK